MERRLGRFPIAAVAMLLTVAMIVEISSEGRENVKEGFSYDDQEIRITSFNQTIHSIPDTEIVGGLEVTPPFPEGIRIIEKTSILSGRVIDSHGFRTCAISPSVGVFCWEIAGEEVIVTQGFENGSRIFSSVSVGRNHTCAVEINDLRNNLFCWGENTNGQVGSIAQTFPTGYEEIIHPQEVSWRKVEAGTEHTCALDEMGGIYCWGHGIFGQLGNSESQGSNKPVKVEFGSSSMINLGGEKIEDISAGGYHNCAISSLGKIYCWGWNGFGQLGLGFYSNSPMALRVDSPSGFYASEISLGTSHSCAEDIQKLEIICWGGNQFGQIDDSSNFSYSKPIVISLDQVNNQIIIGDRHSCFHSSENNISCRGDISLENMTISDVSLVHSSGDGYFCLIAPKKTISCHGSNVDWDLNDIPLGISSLKVVSTVVAGTIVGAANHNYSSNHLIRGSNELGLAAEISIKIEFGNDTDGDGWNDFDEKDCGMDALDANFYPTDWDDDGVCDSNDWDDDGDFVADVKDMFPYDSSEWRDDDRDGIGRNADSIEITGAMFGALVTLFVLVVLASLEIRVTFFNNPKP